MEEGYRFKKREHVTFSPEGEKHQVTHIQAHFQSYPQQQPMMYPPPQQMAYMPYINPNQPQFSPPQVMPMPPQQVPMMPPVQTTRQAHVKFNIETGSTNNEILMLTKQHSAEITPGEVHQKRYEVVSHFYYRKQVYEKVYNDLRDHDKAQCYSNIWYNIKYLGNKYSENLEKAVMKYHPEEFVEPSIPESKGQQGDYVRGRGGYGRGGYGRGDNRDFERRDRYNSRDERRDDRRDRYESEDSRQDRRYADRREERRFEDRYDKADERYGRRDDRFERKDERRRDDRGERYYGDDQRDDKRGRG